MYDEQDFLNEVNGDVVAFATSDGTDNFDKHIDEKPNTFRVNIRVATWINEWFDNKAKETGIAKSALMAMALNEYIDQKESLKAMSRVDFFSNQIEGVKKMINEKIDSK